MNASEFRRVLTTFADNPADVDMTKGRLLVQIRDEVITADLSQKNGELFVREDDTEFAAARWLIERVARLSQLADRILNYTKSDPNFVNPAAKLLDVLNLAPDDALTEVADATSCAREVLSRRPGGTTSVLYLTSDAGEGKTTLINHLARAQAELYRNRKSDFLIVPIALGGRPFLRFDDVVVGALVNRFRFQGLFYEAFIELVRFGVVIPAFDGFEEMFVESASGEALSALGNLVRSLESAGTLLISARKAYFEYQSFATLAKLFDAVGRDSVTFSRLGLCRWDRTKFLAYANKRHHAHAIELYNAVENRLGPNHPVLSRAVLVTRLLDVVKSDSSPEHLTELFGQSPDDYFYHFVNAIIEREVREKWIDRSGQPAQPLLSISEHYDLLSMVAQEMWLGSTDALRAELLNLVAETYSEYRGKSAAVARQVRERLKQHSLITTVEGSTTLFAFDHEDFRQFFLGESLGRLLAEDRPADLQAMLRVGPLPDHACEAAIQLVLRQKVSLHGLITKLVAISKSDVVTSFTRENCGALVIRILATGYIKGESVSEVSFPPDALRGRRLDGILFHTCYFQSSSLEGAELSDLQFLECHFDGMTFGETTRIYQCTLTDCDISVVSASRSETRAFDPSSIRSVIRNAGFSIAGESECNDAPLASDPDEETEIAQNAFRLFLRANQINDDVFQMRLGVRAALFFDEVLPSLIKVGVFEETQYTGSGRGRRFRLAVPMQRIELALRNSNGDFDKFVESFAG
jgi:hypothetical protein